MAQVELPYIQHHTFKKGEKLTYRVHYGLVNAAIASIEILDTTVMIGNRPSFHAVVKANTSGAFNSIYKVNDRYDSFIDENALVPWVFTRRTNEGGYVIHQDYLFNQYKNRVKARRSGSGRKTYTDIIKDSLPPNIQDIFSVFYLFRTLNTEYMEVGDLQSFTAYFDEEVYPIQFRYVGKEFMKTIFGKVECLVYVPVVQKGRVFKDENDLKIWVTNDKNKIPVRIEAELMVGSIKVDLDKAEHLAN